MLCVGLFFVVFSIVIGCGGEVELGDESGCFFKKVGEFCNDNDFCIQDDQCIKSGECVGEVVVCFGTGG